MKRITITGIFSAQFISQAAFITPPSIPSHSERPLLAGVSFSLFAVLFVWRVLLLKVVRGTGGLKYQAAD